MRSDQYNKMSLSHKVLTLNWKLFTNALAFHIKVKLTFKEVTYAKKKVPTIL